MIEFGDGFESERVAMSRVRWLPEAEEDYEEGYEWYFEQSERAAEGLERAVDGAIQKIATSPETYPHCGPNHQLVTMRPYPYRIIYRVDRNEIIIIAVVHGSRQPGFWRTRDRS